MTNRLLTTSIVTAFLLSLGGCMQTLPSNGSGGDVPPVDEDADAQDTTDDPVDDNLDDQGNDNQDDGGQDDTGNDDDGNDPNRPGGDGPPGDDGDDHSDDGTGDDTDDGTDDGTDDPSIPTGPCSDDSSEDNDDLASATILSGDDISGMVSCPEDEDWYAIDMTAGEHLLLTVAFLDDEGDIDVQFLDGASTVLDSGSSGSDDEQLDLDPTVDGTYYIMVRLYSDNGTDVGNPYSFSFGEPPTCSQDSFEQNQSEATAATLSSGTHSSLSVCDYDADWYSIQATAGQTITVTVNFLDAEGDVDATLYDPSGSQAASGLSVSDNEDLGPYTVTQDGLHHLNVRLYSDDGTEYGNTYDLQVTVQ